MPSEGFPFDQHFARQGFRDQERARNQAPACRTSRPSTRSSRRCRSSPTTNCAPRPTNSAPASRSGSAAIRRRARRRSRPPCKADRTSERSKALKEVLDELLDEAFAVVREAGRRVLNMRHFDVQLIGGMVLHEGKICRNEDRRRQNAGRHPSRLSERAQRTRGARGHRQRLPGQARLRVDGQALPLPRTDASASSSTISTTKSAAPPTPPMSPTAPTTNSASTTCATT